VKTDKLRNLKKKKKKKKEKRGIEIC